MIFDFRIGDRVELRNGDIETINEIQPSSPEDENPYPVRIQSGFSFAIDGKCVLGMEDDSDIVRNISQEERNAIKLEKNQEYGSTFLFTSSEPSFPVDVKSELRRFTPVTVEPVKVRSKYNGDLRGLATPSTLKETVRVLWKEPEHVAGEHTVRCVSGLVFIVPAGRRVIK